MNDLICSKCYVQLIHLPDGSDVCPNCDWGDDPLSEEEIKRMDDSENLFNELID